MRTTLFTCGRGHFEQVGAQKGTGKNVFAPAHDRF